MTGLHTAITLESVLYSERSRWAGICNFIQEREPQACQDFMYNIAAHMLAHVEPAGCAIHLALDLQGWQPPRDFMDRFVTRSKRVTKLNGVSDFEITTGEIAAQYAYGQSYLFGTAGALQCALYNKTRQAHSRDKLHFWEGIWKQATGDDPLDEPYDPDQDVWRIEMRFHQFVLREYAQGTPPWRTEPSPRTSASASTTSSARGSPTTRAPVTRSRKAAVTVHQG